jgi:ectoine hydroxylase-related dioxygenase (phytanoyl-CoA dioxygenase family)
MLDATGYCILHDLVPPDVIKAIADDFSVPFEETPFCEGDFYGARTKRFGRLLTRSAHMPRLIEHPDILAIAEHVLLPWCECIQLNLAQAIAIHPGALEQLPHRDQDMWRGDIGTREYLINVIWPIDRFTPENGGTRIWPRTHGKAALETDPPATLPIVACGRPGDAIVFLGSTLHGGGANTSALRRRAIVVSYSLGWLKPYENPWLAYPPEVARTFAPALAALVGYRQHRPNLGNFEGQCPSVLLSDAGTGPLAAIDALRPDQALQLAAHVAGQRASAGPGS